MKLNHDAGRYSLEKLAKAERLYLEDLRKNPKNPEALYGLGCVYALTRDLRRAIELWVRCVEIMPNWGEVHLSLAWAYYQLGQYREAFKHVEKAYKLGVKAKPSDQMFSNFIMKFPGSCFLSFLKKVKTSSLLLL